MENGSGRWLGSLFDTELTQDERLLKLSVGKHPLIPHRLVGNERMSHPFRYTLDCICQRGDVELKHLLAMPAELDIRQADGSYQRRSGFVDTAALLGEDGGVFYYQLGIVPWLSLLQLGQDSRIFQDMNVLDILETVFSAYDMANGRWLIRSQRPYAARSYCVQYRESDFHFISRLMQQEGLYYFFEHSADQDRYPGHRMVITDDLTVCPAVSPRAIRYHRQAATEHQDSITQWGGIRRQQPTRMTIGTCDYRQPSRPRQYALDTLPDQGNLSPQEFYDYPGAYYYDTFDRGRTLVDNRLQAVESLAKRFRGAGGTRQLQAGHIFSLEQHERHLHGDASEREFVVLDLNIQAENALPVSAHLSTLPGSLQQALDQARSAHGLQDESPHQDDYQRAGTGHYLVDFEAQRTVVPFRSTLDHPRPVVGGPHTAIVVGPEGEEIHTDRLNRVKVQFHWDRNGQHDDRSSCWLRVSEANACASWGSVFVPRIGQEVIVDFLEGDPDRPLITGRVYNGDAQPEWHSNGLLSGIKSKTYRGSNYNELVFDDATDQERIRLNSEHAKSQLNLGYLIHQHGNTRGDFRGTGFELRSDAFGAIRANQGLLLTSWGQLGAAGDQLATGPIHQELSSAWHLSDRLSKSAMEHGADVLETRLDLKQAAEDTRQIYGEPNSSAADSDEQSTAEAGSQAGTGQASGLQQPWLHLASPAGIVLSTPASTHLAQHESFSASCGEDINLASRRSLVATIRERLSLFVQRAGIKLFAARGKVEVQAQSDQMALSAEKTLSITSTEGKVRIEAAQGIKFISGGGVLRIKDGDIQIHGPGLVSLKATTHSLAGPSSLDPALPYLPDFAPKICPRSNGQASKDGGGIVEGN